MQGHLKVIKGHYDCQNSRHSIGHIYFLLVVYSCVAPFPRDFTTYTYTMDVIACNLEKYFSFDKLKQGVALTGRNRTGPPCIVGRTTAHAPTVQAPGGPHAGSVTDDDRRQPANNTGQLGGPVITGHVHFLTHMYTCHG